MLVGQELFRGTKIPTPGKTRTNPPEAETIEGDTMTRFLTTTAITLLLGLAPAYAETQAPISGPATAIPAPPAEPASPVSPPQVMAPAPSGTPSQSSEAPKSLVPDQSAAAAEPQSSPFLVKQETSDVLIGNLIGETVVTPNNEAIGEITDLVTDKDGKVLAVLIGAGGFLGIGQKDVAIRFKDIKVSREENNDLTVKANVTKEMIAQAPDYETLDEQQIIMGEKSDRENSSQ